MWKGEISRHEGEWVDVENLFTNLIVLSTNWTHINSTV